MCVNQLGGLGRYRSQFRPNADGNRGTFCIKPSLSIKPLLSVFYYDPNWENDSESRSELLIYLNKLNIETLVNDFGFNIIQNTPYVLISANNLNINFGGAHLDICSNVFIFYENILNTNLGLFIISPDGNGKTFSDAIYEYLLGLKAINTISDSRYWSGIFNLLTGYNFTMTSKSNPVKSLSFNSLTNENYYYLLKNNNWYNIVSN